ncbi:glycosyltransferase [Jejuia pallidilutea]|uniref:Glycosyltransferase n=2 Tax=Jejuia pallidilutea TaxID=504487 RepID=A0A090W3E4_9FLAO|nr:glycosyltransferase [Jejuia pallidilutea]GAL70763.1 glycosyltransferase [Jejuia pallidilutea]GAL90627.1 glycosyltransferase [Jejuia pallidilutea]
MKTKVLFVLPTLTAGGAERVMSFVAQNINNAKFESTLLVTGYKKDAAYAIKGIRVKFLEKSRVFTAVPSIFFFLLKNKPDYVLSSIGHLNTVMGLMAPVFKKTTFIIREASVVSQMSKIHNQSEHKSIYSTLALKAYKQIDMVVCQSKDMAKDFMDMFNIPEHKITIINNPITQSIALKNSTKNNDGVVKFITVGRLSKEKGQLRVLKLLAKLNFNFHYTIIGDGPYKEKINDAIERYNLRDSITQIPFTKDVSKYISESDLFLQGSYVEGFPNTVLESCFVGTPVLAFNVPGGTKEILQHQVNGYLVENEEEYLHYLNNRLSLKPKDIRASVAKKFNEETIIKQYEALFT